MTFFGIDIKERLAELSGHKPKRQGLCGVQITTQGVAAAYILQSADKDPQVQCYDFIPCNPHPDKILSALTHFVKKNKLEGVPCSWILQPHDYTLLPVGVLPVTSDEVPQALQIYVKDRIKTGLSKVVISHFTLPPIHKGSTDEFIYAVVTPKDLLVSTAQLIRQSGLYLQNVDITEFALRNIISLFAKKSLKNLNSGLIEINDVHATLMFIQSEMIYLIRQIEYDKKISEEDNIKKLSLEIQRSVDYYENELGQSPISQFFILPGYEKLYPSLKSGLNFDLQNLALENHLNLSPETEKNQQCLIALGGALRAENAYVTTD
jgi:MSHA biogenesis protein MshI